MRFVVDISLDQDRISKDKNRIIISLLKHLFESYDKDYYELLYKEGKNKRKEFTFSLFMPHCKFERETIVIPEKKIRLNFSTSDVIEAMQFYNAVMSNIGETYEIKNNKLTLESILLVKEKVIYDESAIFKTQSPIVVREHKGDNKKTWYHSLDDEQGKTIFMENLRLQLLDVFGKERFYDLQEIYVEILENKTVKVKNYGIEVLSNIAILKITAKPYILNYLYQSGIGGKRNSGFGMLDIL